MKTRKRKQKEQQLTMEAVDEFLLDIDESDTMCRICMAEFVDPEDLKCHMSGLHHDVYRDNNFCKLCFKSISNAEDFALHIRDHHLQNVKICPYCFRLFSNYSLYKAHKAKHLFMGRKNTMSCSNCPCLFKDVIELTTHEYEQHKEAEGIMINHCFPHLSSILNMWVISFFKRQYSNFYCMPCFYKTTELEEYIQHLKSCGQKSLVCNKCLKPLKSRNVLINHMSVNDCKTKKNQKFLECKICYKLFTKELFVKHSKNCLKCKHCDEIFDNVSKLAAHQATHKSFTATLLYCKYCTANFVNKTALHRHVERSHKHEIHLYKYKCNICNEVYKHPKYLFQHYFGKHKELLPYKCSICNEKFKTRKSFTIHIKVVHKSKGSVKFDENFLVYFTRGDQDVNIHDHNYGGIDAQVINNIVDDDTSNVNIDTNSVEQEITLENVNDSTEANNVNDTSNEMQIHNVSDDDLPLSTLKKQSAKRKHRYIKQKTKNYNRFTCSKCNLRCYTFQHYNRHMSTHSSKILKQCVKCNEFFKKTKDLEEHVKSKHSRSQLTDTLKKVMERRNLSKGSISDKFRCTFKKVWHTNSDGNLKIREYTKSPNVTVKNFIENFTGDLDNVDTSKATLRVMHEHIHRQPVIQLTKVENSTKDVEYEGNIKMPTKVTQENSLSCNVIVKVIKDAEHKKPVLNFGYNLNEYKYSDDNNIEYGGNYIGDDKMDTDDKSSIAIDFTPEASNEVFLRESTHPPDIKVVIPNIPSNTDLKIGCLTPQAPYFNIVSINKILEKTPSQEDPDISLPSGEKLVNVNPLEHLLVGKHINVNLAKSKNRIPAKDAIKNALIRYKLWKPKRDNRKKIANISKNDSEEMWREP